MERHAVLSVCTCGLLVLFPSGCMVTRLVSCHMIKVVPPTLRSTHHTVSEPGSETTHHTAVAPFPLEHHTELFFLHALFICNSHFINFDSHFVNFPPPTNKFYSYPVPPPVLLHTSPHSPLPRPSQHLGAMLHLHPNRTN